MQTYWLELPTNSSSKSSGSSVGGTERMEDDVFTGMASCVHDEKTQSLIAWNGEVLLRLLKQIVARREACEGAVTPGRERVQGGDYCPNEGTTPLDEVKEIISLPKFQKAKMPKDPSKLVLDPAVVKQLFDFVSTIATKYRSNPFHNFEHASHVSLSVVKLLSRIVAPTSQDLQDSSHHGGSATETSTEATLHDHTYGITSDPLTQFACVLSALIHDVDHPGIPNAQLVREETELATKYHNKSVAEQNSVDLAWNLLMDPDYNDLRNVIYTTNEDMIRFRQIVVNAVLATDIVDKDLKALRNARWDRAFAVVACTSGETAAEADDDAAAAAASNDRDTINRKATIVIEHLLQASDVAHTMQHWHIYRKWNERFFLECHQAYQEGRADCNPADGWYQGELGFFDFYIIPLARKLKDCGVFGVSSDEYLNYALQNRSEWEKRGRDVVNELIGLVQEQQQLEPIM
jgi:3'5'-cyclic nucleotide phosphodiesterase